MFKKIFKILAVIGLVLILVPFLLNGITYWNLSKRELSRDSIGKKLFVFNYGKQQTTWQKFRKFSVIEIKIGKSGKFRFHIQSILQKDYIDMSFVNLFKGIYIYQRWTIEIGKGGFAFDIIDWYIRI